MGEASRELDVLAVGMMMAEISPPRFGQTIGEAKCLRLFPAGSATIFALALARLGGRIGLISRVGDDELGRWMVASVERAGIDTRTVRAVPGQLTPVSLASVDARGGKQFSYYRFPRTCDPLATLTNADVSDAELARASIFDLTEGSLRAPEIRAVAMNLARRARRLGATVCFNANYRAAAWPGGEAEARAVLGAAVAEADLAIMNAAEARLIGRGRDQATAVERLGTMGPGLVVVTRGAAGVLVAAAGRLTELSVPPAEVVFDIGAGDTFHAGFLAVWRPGIDPLACARFASAAAAVKIGRPPAIAAMPTRADVLARLHQVDPAWPAP